MRKNGGRIITLVLCLVLIIPLVSLLATAGRTSSAANGKDGRDGKSAYQYAVDGGYVGSESDFSNDLKKAADSYELLGLEYPYDKQNLPIVYLEGDTSAMTKDNKVTLNYTYGDKSGTCSVKWQGSSSLQFPKKNYTITFDNAFEAVEGWGEQSKYCLKADWVDFSHARNVVSAGLWGDIVATRKSSELTDRLNTLPNGGAIDGFPCFVVINGEWQGIYNFNIPKDGWMMGMGTGEKEAILCAENTTPCKFTEQATVGTDFDVEYNSESFTESEIQESLNRLINACINSDGTDIDTVIAQYVDIDSAIDYMIYSQLLCNWDGVQKNYLISTYDGTKWFFTAYDVDLVFGLGYPGTTFENPERDDWVLTHKLFGLLWKYKFDAVKERYEEIVSTVMSKGVVSKKFSDYCANITLTAYDAEMKLWTTLPSTSVNNVAQIIGWYDRRFDVIADKYAREAALLGSNGLEYKKDESGLSSVCAGIGTCAESDIEIAVKANNISVGEISANAFDGNSILEKVRFASGSCVYIIRSYAFARCPLLESVEFPSSLRIVGYGSFAYCTSLKLVRLPEGVRTIEGSAFAHCTSLERIYIPHSVTKINAKILYNCTSLKQIIYNGTVEEWNAIEKGVDWDTGTGSYTVYCTDGKIVKNNTY